MTDNNENSNIDDYASNAQASANKAQTHAEAALAASQQATDAASQSVTNAQTITDKLNEALGHAETTKNNAATANDNAVVAQTSAIQATDNANQISTILGNVQEDANLSKQAYSEAKDFRQKAEAEAKKAAQAHNMSTTAGLAGAFTAQAFMARVSMYVWGVVLITALFGVYFIGHARFDEVLALLQKLTENNQLLATIGTQILISLISVFAPLWLAWMASRMMSKYFSLAEDYSYKAAIAKAYIGFKEQAEGLDKIFEERLFAAAITQLDASPLRLFEKEKHPSSPLQDLLQQPFMQSVLKDNLIFKESFVGWMSDVFRTKFYLPKIVWNPSNEPKPPTD